eukprot:4378966-Alexandrium_andersonii.AAC.1
MALPPCLLHLALIGFLASLGASLPSGLMATIPGGAVLRPQGVLHRGHSSPLWPMATIPGGHVLTPIGVLY